jgi:hypothetical protein
MNVSHISLTRNRRKAYDHHIMFSVNRYVGVNIERMSIIGLDQRTVFGEVKGYRWGGLDEKCVGQNDSSNVP